MSLLDRISIDPTVRFGKPCVRGTRITVGDILGYLADDIRRFDAQSEQAFLELG